MDTLLLHFIIMFCLLFGLLITFMPKFPGNFIIFSIIIFYGVITDFISFSLLTTLTICSLMLVGEIGTRLLHWRLRRKMTISQEFAANAVAGNAAGIIALDAMIGSVGWWVWQLIAGKNLFPRFDAIGQVFVKSSIAASLRIFCGFMMIIIFYIFIAR